MNESSTSAYGPSAVATEQFWWRNKCRCSKAEERVESRLPAGDILKCVDNSAVKCGGWKNLLFCGIMTVKSHSYTDVWSMKNTPCAMSWYIIGKERTVLIQLPVCHWLFWFTFQKPVGSSNSLFKNLLTGMIHIRQHPYNFVCVRLGTVILSSKDSPTSLWQFAIYNICLGWGDGGTASSRAEAHP